MAEATKDSQKDFGLLSPWVAGAVEEVYEATIKHPTSTGTKFDNGKPMMAYLDCNAIMQEAAVFTFGADKYAPWNWRNGLTMSRLLSASLRHIFQFLAGQDNDPESGLSHLAHARCNLAMAMWTLEHRKALDDRYTPPELPKP